MNYFYKIDEKEFVYMENTYILSRRYNISNCDDLVVDGNICFIVTTQQQTFYNNVIGIHTFGIREETQNVGEEKFELYNIIKGTNIYQHKHNI